MGFALLPADPPAFPHIVCAGSGFAWHDDERRRRCYSGDSSVPAPVVAAAIDGHELKGIDRILAVANFYKESGSNNVALIRVFRKPCPACDANHLERAQQAIRAARLIHVDAIDALRIADVSETFMRYPNVMGDPSYTRKPRGKVGRRVPPENRIPVYFGDSARTKMAQIAFASHYAARMGR